MPATLTVAIENLYPGTTKRDIENHFRAYLPKPRPAVGPLGMSMHTNSYYCFRLCGLIKTIVNYYKVEDEDEDEQERKKQATPRGRGSQPQLLIIPGSGSGSLTPSRENLTDDKEKKNSQERLTSASKAKGRASPLHLASSRSPSGVGRSADALKDALLANERKVIHRKKKLRVATTVTFEANTAAECEQARSRLNGTEFRAANPKFAFRVTRLSVRSNFIGLCPLIEKPKHQFECVC